MFQISNRFEPLAGKAASLHYRKYGIRRTFPSGLEGTQITTLRIKKALTK